ncbi:hypothetical protein GWI33_003928 [Rhynchophorus ferrugineus]|uniref:Uncharacterized protein n=1 Tax=Rhynchophorus ferrugineus TaxID=354439 RepID=A0A834HW52_RHYFE|nr:hypothetical protein GWI33_003928 [Rhynchophorus ferrugineus]
MPSIGPGSEYDILEIKYRTITDSYPEFFTSHRPDFEPRDSANGRESEREKKKTKDPSAVLVVELTKIKYLCLCGVTWCRSPPPGQLLGVALAMNTERPHRRNKFAERYARCEFSAARWRVARIPVENSVPKNLIVSFLCRRTAI